MVHRNRGGIADGALRVKCFARSTGDKNQVPTAKCAYTQQKKKKKT